MVSSCKTAESTESFQVYLNALDVLCKLSKRFEISHVVLENWQFRKVSKQNGGYIFRKVDWKHFSFWNVFLD